MIREEKMRLIEYEMELIINKQLYQEKHITHEVYRKVANMILKDIENQMKRLEAPELVGAL